MLSEYVSLANVNIVIFGKSDGKPLLLLSHWLEDSTMAYERLVNILLKSSEGVYNSIKHRKHTKAIFRY